MHKQADLYLHLMDPRSDGVNCPPKNIKTNRNFHVFQRPLARIRDLTLEVMEVTDMMAQLTITTPEDESVTTQAPEPVTYPDWWFGSGDEPDYK